MDMRVYYRKVREIEEKLPADSLVVVSKETSEGGKAGVLTEVSRRNAAKLLVEDRVTLATEEEAQRFHEAQAEARRAAEQIAAATRMQVTVVPTAEWQKMKTGNRPTKE
jgi:hypothetical protein